MVEIHVWVTEFVLALQGNKILAKMGYDIEMLGVWQWSLLWLLAPTEENDFLDRKRFLPVGIRSGDSRAAPKEVICRPFVNGRTPRDLFLSAVKENWHTLSVDEDQGGDELSDVKLDGWELGVWRREGGREGGGGRSSGGASVRKYDD